MRSNFEEMNVRVKRKVDVVAMILAMASKGQECSGRVTDDSREVTLATPETAMLIIWHKD
jgi:hypothetical protein